MKTVRSLPLQIVDSKKFPSHDDLCHKAETSYNFFLLGFPTKICYAFIIFPISVCPTHLISFDLITLVLRSEKCKL
jgi:hypothetical protein